MGSPTTAPVLCPDPTLSTSPMGASRPSTTMPTTLTATSPRCPTPERPSTLPLLPTPLLPTLSTLPPSLPSSVKYLWILFLKVIYFMKIYSTIKFLLFWFFYVYWTHQVFIDCPHNLKNNV